MEDLDPLIAHLEDKRNVTAQTSFVRGTHMPDGRLDLCKQVVGPDGIAPVLDALADHRHVSRFMIGNNIVGNSGAAAAQAAQAAFQANSEAAHRVLRRTLNRILREQGSEAAQAAQDAFQASSCDTSTGP